MNNKIYEPLRWQVKERVKFIAAQLQNKRKVNRSDICVAFCVSTAQASNDIALFKKVYPGFLAYDLTAKGYAPTAKFDAWFRNRP